MNGYLFTRKVLEATQFDVEPLIKNANGHENEWLEFKAALFSPTGTFDRGECEGLLRWNIGKALVAMATGTGGALILGLSETKDNTLPVQHVDLALSGFKGDFDSFLRELDDTVVHPPLWRTANKGQWQCDTRIEVEIRKGNYGEHPVIVFLVPPAPESSEPLLVNHFQKDINKEYLLYRAPGDFGKINTLDGTRAINAWWKDRKVERPELDKRLENFLSQHDALKFRDRYVAPSADEEKENLEVALTRYRQAFRSKWDQETKGRDAVANRPESYSGPQAVFESNLSVFQPVYKDHADSAGTAGGNPPELQMVQDEDRAELSVLLAEWKRLFILGEPGSGKTTLLKLAVYDRLKNASHLMPLFVPLSGFSETETLLGRVSSFTEISENLIKAGIALGRVSLVLDGLNEAGAGRDRLREELTQLQANFPMVCLVVSSRTIEDSAGLKVERICKVPQFNRNEQVQFLGRVFPHLFMQANRILDLIHKQPGGEKLASNPLNLCLIAGLDQSDLERAGRTNLYRLAFEKWLIREREQMERTGEDWLLNFDEIIEGLAQIAFTMRLQGVLRAKLTDPAFDQSGELAQPLIQMIVRLSQLPNFFTCDPDTHSFAFAHETFQEYFTAVYLASHPQELPKIRQIPGKHWSLVISMLFDLGPQANTEFVQALWTVDPLYALYSPAHDSAFPSDLPDTDPWRSLFARVMLKGPSFLAQLDIMALPPMPDSTAQSILSDEQLWQSSSCHTPSMERVDRLTKLGLSQFDPFGILIKYLARARPSLQTDFDIPNVGWMLFSLGVKGDFFVEQEQLPYLANSILAYSADKNTTQALIKLSGEFSAFFANPQALSLHLWRRMISQISTWKDLRTIFPNKARAYEYRILKIYPELALLESDFLKNEWSYMPADIQDFLLGQGHVPTVTLLEMLQSGLIRQQLLPPSIKKGLDQEVARDASTLIAAVQSGFIKAGELTSDIKGKFLQDLESTRLLVSHGVIRLDELWPSRRGELLAEMSVVDLVQGLNGDVFSWASLDDEQQVNVRALLSPGTVIRNVNSGKACIDRGSIELIRQLQRQDDIGYADRLLDLYFVMSVPKLPGKLFYHPMLPQKVSIKGEARRAMENARLVITRLSWHSDSSTYQFADTPVLVSKLLLRKVFPTDEQLANALSKSINPSEVLTDEEKDILIRSDRTSGKIHLLRHDMKSLAAIHAHESKTRLPDVRDLTDAALRLSTQSLLAGKTWTLPIVKVDETQRGSFFYANHPSLPSNFNNISGSTGNFPLEINDVLVATVEIVPVPHPSGTQYRYTVINGKIVQGLVDQRKFEQAMLLMDAYKPEAASRVLADHLEAGETDFISRLLIRNPAAEVYLNRNLSSQSPVLVNHLGLEQISKWNSQVGKRPWVFTITEVNQRDAKNNAPYFTTEHPFFLRSKGNLLTFRLYCKEDDKYEVGQKILIWVEFRESGKEYAQSKLARKSRDWVVINPQENNINKASQKAVELLTRVFTSHELETFNFRPEEIVEGFIGNLITGREKELVPKLTEKGLIDPILGLTLILKSRIDPSDVADHILSQWFMKANADTLQHIINSGVLVERQIDLTYPIQEGLKTKPSEEFIHWVIDHSPQFMKNGFEPDFRKALGESAPIRSLLRLLQANLLSPSDISGDRIKKNLTDFTVDGLNNLLFHGLINLGNLPAQRQPALYRAAVARDPEQGKVLLKQVSQDTANWLVSEGSACLQDLPQPWLRGLLLKLEKPELIKLVKRDGFTREHLSKIERANLIDYSKLADLVNFAQLGLIDGTDVDEQHLLTLVSSKTSLAFLLELIQLKLVSPAILKNYVTVQMSDPISIAILTDISIELAIRAIKLEFLKLSDFSAEKRKEFAQQIYPHNAASAVSCKLVVIEDIEEDKLKALLEYIGTSASRAVSFCLAGIFSPEQFPVSIRLGWAGSATDSLLPGLIDSGLLDQPVFSALSLERRENLLGRAIFAAKLSALGIVSSQDLEQYRPAWIESEDIIGLCGCLKLGLLQAPAIPDDRIKHWFDISSPQQIAGLIEAGLPLNSAQNRLPELFESLPLEQLLKASAQSGMSAEMVPSQVRIKRVRNSSPESVFRLLKSNVVLKSDVPVDVVRKWIRKEQLSRHWAVMFRGVDLLPDELITNTLKKEWALELRTLSSAVTTIQAGLFTWKEIPFQKRGLLLFSCSAQNAVQAILACVVDKDAFSNEQKKRFVVEARNNEKISQDLYELGLIPSEEPETEGGRLNSDPADSPETVAVDSSESPPRTGRYSRAVLLDANQAAMIKAELNGQRWEMKVSRTIPPGNVGFLTHTEFPDGVFFHSIKFAGKTGLIAVGDVVEVTVTVGNDRKTNSPSYRVSDGTFKHHEPPTELTEIGNDEAKSSLLQDIPPTHNTD